MDGKGGAGSSVGVDSEYSCETYRSEVQLAISRTEHGWYISERVSTNDGQSLLGAASPEIPNPNLAMFRPCLTISYRFGCSQVASQSFVVLVVG